MSRVNIQKSQPDAYKAMFALEEYLASSTITKDLQELVRIRASVINGCHFCIGLHSSAAKKIGISAEKVTALANWHNSDLFSKKEKIALKFTDGLTNVSSVGVTNDVYQAAEQCFSTDEIAQLIMLIATINAWNRLGVAMSDNSI